MEDSVFTKIIKGELPCYKVYEDAKTFAFLTINPIQPGHVLVIPKKQIDHLWDLPDDEYLAVMTTSKKVAQRIRDVLQPLRVGVHVMGTEVPHAHVHLYPFNDEIEMWERPHSTPPAEELKEMAARLRMEDNI